MSASFTFAKALSATSTVVLKKILHRGGNFPGKIALYADKELFAHLRGNLSEGSILIVGTNGKTTCTLLTADILEAQGFDVICNRSGANLDSGVATALLQNKRAQWGVFEIDEMWLAKVLPQLQCTYVMLLNLFPDQEDRMTIADIQKSIIGAMESSPQTTLIYNADDPNCTYIARAIHNPSIPVGTESDFLTDELSCEDIAQYCPECGGALHYTMRQYDQLGAFACAKCDFSRPELDGVIAQVTIENDLLKFDYRGNADPWHIEAAMPAYYIAYNLGLVCAFVQQIGCSQNIAQKTIAAFNPQNGRLQTLRIKGHEVLVNLAKNPAGFNQNIRLIVQEPSDVCAAFFVNNKEGDGRTTDWLDSVRFEVLARKAGANQIFVGGMCAQQLLDRLARAGITALVVRDAAEVFDSAAAMPGAKVFLIANYTALPSVREQAEELANA